MKNKLLKRLAVLGSAICLGLSGVAVAPVSTITAKAAMPDTAGTQQEIIGYVYAKSEGKLYKCLFNYSTGHWIGDWIYVRDLRPEEM